MIGDDGGSGDSGGGGGGVVVVDPGELESVLCARAHRFSLSLSPIRPLPPLPYPLAVKPASKRTKNGATRYHYRTIEQR